MNLGKFPVDGNGKPCEKQDFLRMRILASLYDQLVPRKIGGIEAKISAGIKSK